MIEQTWKIVNRTKYKFRKIFVAKKSLLEIFLIYLSQLMSKNWRLADISSHGIKDNKLKIE